MFKLYVKLFWFVIVYGIEDLLPGKILQTVNDIVVGRIRRQKRQVDAQRFCCNDYCHTVLVAGIVQYEDNGRVREIFHEPCE